MFLVYTTTRYLKTERLEKGRKKEGSGKRMGSRCYDYTWLIGCSRKGGEKVGGGKRGAKSRKAH